jgi:two-component system sensor histidine kinase and response regulator WspE
MSNGGTMDLGAFSLVELFRQEVTAQAEILSEGLLAAERGPVEAATWERLMRAAHSVKGAARIVNQAAAVRVAHALEDEFTEIQHGRAVFAPAAADVYLAAVDLLSRLAQLSEAEAEAWPETHQAEMDSLLQRLAATRTGTAPAVTAPVPVPCAPVAEKKAADTSVRPAPATMPAAPEAAAPPVAAGEAGTGLAVRVSSTNLNRVMDLAGEVVVRSRWFTPHASRLQSLRQRLATLADGLAALHREQADTGTEPATRLEALQAVADSCRRDLALFQEDTDTFGTQYAELAERLYREAVGSRMRPFRDGAGGFPRMLRDLARDLGKKVKFELRGPATPVDREILDKLEAPVTHLLRNALDHGLETPAAREAAGKPAEGTLVLEAAHRSGRLVVSVSDDGSGIDVERLRQRVVERGLATPEVAGRLTQAELFEFLFLPGFSTAERVTEISGRGVGLDVVRNLAHELGGSVQVESRPGQGTRFTMQLPITLSMLRVLLFLVADHPYALPLSRVRRLLLPGPEEICLLEGRRYVQMDERSVGLVEARVLLGLDGGAAGGGEAQPVVVLGDGENTFGLAVDRLLGESRVVVRPLDPRLGKLRDLAATALLEDGRPLVILDPDDLARSIEARLAGGGLRESAAAATAATTAVARRRILVVDDSFTVREVERGLLAARGYEVEVAVDGMDGWNCLRSGRFDLVVSDVDMPRMNGHELARRIKADPRLRDLPVMMVSYKDREEDRLLGLEAGADLYLPKSEFRNDGFLRAVADLLGEDAPA